MKVLFFVEPLIMHSRPFHYWAWLGYFADMFRTVVRSGGEARIIVNEGLALRALAPLGSGQHYARKGQGLAPEDLLIFAQTEIRRFFDLPNVEILRALHEGSAPDATRRYGELIRESLGGFVPDVMMTLTPAAQLESAFPNALLLAAETAAYSREPFPSCLFFDPGGLWGDSLLARHAEDLGRFQPSAEELELASDFRTRFQRYFTTTTPFASLERRLRHRYERIAFLPLQFGGESGFDLNAPFRTQGEYLFHVIEQLPTSTAVVVVEHPTAHWVGDVIDEETRQLLSERYPQVEFVDFRSAPSAGQYLVHHADFVIGVSTSLALQAVLFDKPLVSVGHSHLNAFASVRGIENLGAEVPPARTSESLVAWLVNRYFVPRALVSDPRWLLPFLERSLARRRAGVTGPEFFDPIAPAPQLRELLFEHLSGGELRARLTNGDFKSWPNGEGPFGPGQSGPAGWQLLDFGGSATSLSARFEGAEPSGVRWERGRTGNQHSLLVQRVPELAAAAGCLARLSFVARGGAGAKLGAYFYLQFNDGRPAHGTTPAEFELTGEWQEHSYVAAVPPLAGRIPGSGNHLEVVLTLPRECGATTVELQRVSLEPARA